jgi:hypothetical protein
MRITSRFVIVLPLAILLGLLWASPHRSHSEKLILAPMIGGLDQCLFNDTASIQALPQSQFKTLCLDESRGSTGATKIVEASLGALSTLSEHQNYTLGYTLYIPLLKLVDLKDQQFVVNEQYLDAITRTIEQVNRPVVLYLFSNHFEVGSALEQTLAHDPANLLQTRASTLEKYKYYGINIYPWNFTRLDNSISKVREMAMNALVGQVCKLSSPAQRNVAGLTVLGELHHLFPDFQGGMGYTGDYLITDYSDVSVAGFRGFLRGRFASIHTLNQQMGSAFGSFDDIFPPGKDIRKERLNHYFEHIDAYAQGSFPVAGWLKRPTHEADTPVISVYVDGVRTGEAAVGLSRQDVLAAHPEFGTADVGWRYELEYARLPSGLHQLDVFLERKGKPMERLASRQFAVMARDQSPPQMLPQATLPQSVVPEDSTRFHVDSPKDKASYFFNPLVVLWHTFRGQQVNQYLAHFGHVAERQCIEGSRVFSHQIVPFANPDWDPSKYATDDGLSVPHTMRLGASLYGETSYGRSFEKWFESTGRSAYAVTEFHPLKPMNSAALDQVLMTHRQNGAVFLSFFINAYGLQDETGYTSNPFSFDPNNSQADSDTLYSAIQDILQ